MEEERIRTITRRMVPAARERGRGGGKEEAEKEGTSAVAVHSSRRCASQLRREEEEKRRKGLFLSIHWCQPTLLPAFLFLSFFPSLASAGFCLLTLPPVPFLTWNWMAKRRSSCYSSLLSPPPPPLLERPRVL